MNWLKILKYTFLIAISLISTESSAALFDVVPTDKSMQYLGLIFGGSVGVIGLGAGSNPLLSNMFEVFNFIIVTAGVAVLSYAGVVAAINTAREGEALGKKFSLWVPLRGLFGMLLMLPTPGTGYSVIQMTVMWLVLNGIGAANAVWNVVINQIASGVTSVGSFQVNIPTAQLMAITQPFLEAATCLASINRMTTLPLLQNNGPVQLNVQYLPPSIPQDPTSSNAQISQTAYINVGIPNTTFNNICGSFSISTFILKSDPTQTFNLPTLLRRLNIKVNAVQSMFNTFSGAATILAQPYNPLTDPVSPPLPTTGYSLTAAQNYKAQIAALAGGINVARGPQAAAWEANPLQINPNSSIAAMQRIGWIHAGSYYYTMVQASNGSLGESPNQLLPSALSSPPIPSQVGVNLMDPSQIPPSSQWSSNLFNALSTPVNRVIFNSALTRATTFWPTDQSYTPDSLPVFGTSGYSTGNSVLDSIISTVTSTIRDPILNFFTQGIINQTQDMLITAGNLGWSIMIAGESAFFIAIVLMIAIIIPLSIPPCLNPVGMVFSAASLMLYTVLFSFLLILWTTGAMLGVYLPLVPYLIFATTAIGWFMAVVEAIVGAPIIALAMVLPSGEELGQIKHGINILLNLFFRPTLMIFGFVIAGSLMNASAAMINYGFVAAVDQSVQPTLFNIVPVLGIYMFLMISLVNNAFSLIYELPNKIMGYMGAKGEAFTPGEMMKEARGGFDKGAEVGKEMVGKSIEAGKSVQEGARRAAYDI